MFPSRLGVEKAAKKVARNKFGETPITLTNMTSSQSLFSN